MKKLGCYLAEHWKCGLLYAGAAVSFAAVDFLYRVDMSAILYAILLSAVWLLAAAVPDFAGYVRRCRERERAARCAEFQEPEFQSSRTLEERQYQQIIKKLWEKKTEQESMAAIARQESMDYYSLWAHQIKTPIAAMRLLLQSQEEEVQGLADPEREAFFRDMGRELFRTEQYVEMVMNYLRIEDISRDIVLQWCQLDNLVKQAVRKYSRLFILEKLRLDYRPSGAEVLTDEKWLVLVIEQILSNALKYTGSGSISIWTEMGEKNVTLMIRDTGIGIYREDLPRVFERGFTGYNGREHKKSTGIGLYLCRRIMDRLGHDIRIDSAPGEGTTVALELGRTPVRPE